MGWSSQHSRLVCLIAEAFYIETLFYLILLFYCKASEILTNSVIISIDSPEQVHHSPIECFIVKPFTKETSSLLVLSLLVHGLNKLFALDLFY
jgi:hypothetical protein